MMDCYFFGQLFVYLFMFALFAVPIIYFLLPSLPTLFHHHFYLPLVHHHLTMSLAAAVDFIRGPLASYLTAPIGRARATEAPRTGNPSEDYLSGSENSTSGSDSGSGIGYKDSGDCQQTSRKHLPGSLAISSFRSATAKSVDRVGSAEDFEFANPVSFANPDAKVQSDQDSGFFGFPSSKRSFTIPFVSGLRSKLLAVTGIGAFSSPKGNNTAEGQLLSEFILSSVEIPASSKATGSSVLPCPIKPPCSSHSANATGLSVWGVRYYMS